MSTEDTPPSRTFILASRASDLAKTQTNGVRDALSATHPSTSFTTSFMSTGGDADKTQPLYLVGGKAFWTKELEVALRERAVDILVHCFKDVPTALPAGCEIAGVLERADPVDALIIKKGAPESWRTLEDLPEGSVVGTSSVRRVAQLKRRYPGLVFKDLRGNLDTRLAKLDAPDSPFAAIVLAKAGMVRLGWGGRITSDLGPPTLLYAVSQGALALEVRSDDTAARALCRGLTHWQTEWRCCAERALLRVLEGGCSVPVGVHTSLEDETPEAAGRRARLAITGCVTSLGGDRHIEHTIEAEVRAVEEAEAVGVRLAKLLIDTGARDILDEICADRETNVELGKVTDQDVDE